jgi:hypothetical protein
MTTRCERLPSACQRNHGVTTARHFAGGKGAGPSRKRAGDCSAIDATEYARARGALAPFIAAPTQRVAIERTEQGDSSGAPPAPCARCGCCMIRCGPRTATHFLDPAAGGARLGPARRLRVANAGRSVALRRQRSHVRIVSGAPVKPGTSEIYRFSARAPGKHRVSSASGFVVENEGRGQIPASCESAGGQRRDGPLS